MADFAGIPRLDRLSNQELSLTLQRLQANTAQYGITAYAGEIGRASCRERV